MRYLLALALLPAALAACSTVSLEPAPVVNKTSAPVAGAGQSGAGGAPTGPLFSGPFAARAGQAGFYTVQHGDTLRRIALQFGQDWRQVQKWNGLDNPNVIEVGRVLRVAAPAPGEPVEPPPPPPASATAQAFALAPPAPASAPASAAPVAPTATAAVAESAVKPAARPVAKAAAPAASGASAAAKVAKAARPAAAGDIQWQWPVSGKVIQGFNGSTSKGLDLAGKMSDPVFAAAGGKVVYAGSELRGFGNLVILKHGSDYISVYAHNDKLLVKDGEEIKRGQQIALMGSSDAPRVELHFEVRLRGKPIDPLQVLPPR